MIETDSHAMFLSFQESLEQARNKPMISWTTTDTMDVICSTKSRDILEFLFVWIETKIRIEGDTPPGDENMNTWGECLKEISTILKRRKE